MAVFLIIFFSVYGGTHAYAFAKARAAFQFGPRVGVPLAVLMLALTAAPILVRLAESSGHDLLARGISHVGYMWMGLLFLFFSASVAIDAYRLAAFAAGRLFPHVWAIASPGAAASFYAPLAYAVLALAYGSYAAWDVRTERITVETDKLPQGVQAVRIVQISDVHLGLVVRGRRLRVILDRVREARPDVLVSTGDLVDGQINGMPGLAAMFREVNPPLGKFAITGNHEFYAGLGQALAFTREAGFKMLRGRGEAVGGAIALVGVDDHADRIEGAVRTSAREAAAGLPPGLFTVLLKHRPVIEPGSEGRFDLQLSGHTHKGQLFPFSFVVRAFFPYLAGRYDVGGGSVLYVSRGSGTWGPPVRVLSPPEVTVIDIVPWCGE